ncbi:MAG: poly-beta-1,6-N-acetyl-D-glucosamine biosynthesis protein PgaD [Proteobacteria bacterium]|nr:poly-beta-1,6-N-acetyl-D-glucosamine biosynthesis protein PgaD [Pseudomonadota bacterium]
MKQLIFEKPSLAPLPNRIGWTFFTAFFWMIWGYLWMPLVTLILWAMGVMAYVGYGEYNVGQEWQQLGKTMLVYLAVIATLGGSLLGWARIEFMRFHNVNRRTRPEQVSTEELAAYANLPATDLAEWKNARRVVAFHDAHGHVIRGETTVPLHGGNTEKIYA